MFGIKKEKKKKKKEVPHRILVTLGDGYGSFSMSQSNIEESEKLVEQLKKLDPLTFTEDGYTIEYRASGIMYVFKKVRKT